MAAGSKQLTKSATPARTKRSGESPLVRLRNYVDELKREMRLVTWPSREQVWSTTVVVLVTVLVFAVFFGVVDYVLAIGQTRLYQYFTS